MTSDSAEAPALSIVVPVYNEEANIRPFLERLEAALADSVSSYEVLFCLDPCPDRTEQIIQKEIERNSAVKLLVFFPALRPASGNHGRNTPLYR